MEGVRRVGLHHHQRSLSYPGCGTAKSKLPSVKRTRFDSIRVRMTFPTPVASSTMLHEGQT